MATDRETLMGLVSELRALAGARSNAGAAMNAFANTMAGRLIIDAAQAGPLAKEAARQAKWSAKDYMGDAPNLGPLMAKIEALAGTIAASEGITLPSAPAPADDNGVAKLTDIVSKLAARVESLQELVLNEYKARTGHEESVTGK